MKGHWADGAVAVAHQKGFLNGYGNGTFRPNQPMTRQEAVVALATGLRLPASSASQQAAIRRVPGGDKIADWALERFTAASEAGLLQNVNLTFARGNLDPLSGLERGQLASFIFHALGR